VSEDVELLPEPENARVKARDRKVRGPKVVVDNAGLRKVQMQLCRAAPGREAQAWVEAFSGLVVSIDWVRPGGRARPN